MVIEIQSNYIPYRPKSQEFITGFANFYFKKIDKFRVTHQGAQKKNNRRKCLGCSIVLFR